MAGGFMSGFGPAFGKSFTSQIEAGQKRYNDAVKTKMAFALDQKTAFDKAKAADAAMVKQAESLAAQVPGAPDEAYKVAYSQLKAGRDEEKILEEMRKGSWTAVQTPEKGPELDAPSAETTTESLQKGAVEAQMDQAMGEPVEQPKAAQTDSESVTEVATAPKEEKGMFDKLTEGLSDFQEAGRQRRADRVQGKVLDDLGMSQDEYSAMISGYTSDVDTGMKGFQFTPDLSEDADKLPTTPKGVSTYLFTQSDEYKTMLKKGDREGINKRLMEIEEAYDGKEGSAAAPYYGIKLSGGLTEAKVDALEANIRVGLESGNPDLVQKATEYQTNVLPVWRSLTDDNGTDSGGITEKDILKMNAIQLQGTIVALEAKESLSESEQGLLSTAKTALTGQKGAALEEQNLGETEVERVRVPDGNGGWTTTPALKQRTPNGIEYLPVGANASVEGAMPITKDEENALNDVQQFQNTFIKAYKDRSVRLEDTLQTVYSVEEALRSPEGALYTTSIGGINTMGSRILNEMRAAGQIVKSVDENGRTIEDRILSFDEAAQAADYNSFADMEEAANVRGDVQAKIMLLGFRAGAIEGQSGAAMSNKDFERFMSLFKSATRDPIAMANKLHEYFGKEVTQLENMRRAYSIDPSITGFERKYGYTPYTSELPPLDQVSSPQARELIDYFRSAPPKVEEAPQEGGSDPQASIDAYMSGQPITWTAELAERFPKKDFQIGQTIRKGGTK